MVEEEEGEEKWRPEGEGEWKGNRGWNSMGRERGGEVEEEEG